MGYLFYLLLLDGCSKCSEVISVVLSEFHVFTVFFQRLLFNGYFSRDAQENEEEGHRNEG